MNLQPNPYEINFSNFSDSLREQEEFTSSLKEQQEERFIPFLAGLAIAGPLWGGAWGRRPYPYPQPYPVYYPYPYPIYRRFPYRRNWW